MRKFLRVIGCVMVGAVIMLGMTGLSAAQDKPYAGVTIEHWSLLNPEGDSPRERALKKIIENFEKKTGTKVKVQTLPWQDLDAKLMAAVQAGNPPDVSRVNLFWLKRHLAAGSLMPLNQYVNATYTPEEKKDFLLYDELVEDGKKWTFLIALVLKALYIREDLLENVGMEPPTTWHDFIQIGQALTTEKRAGYLFGASKVQPNQVEMIFQPMIHGRGGKILNKEEKAVFNSEEGVQTYAYLRDLVHKYRIVPKEVVNMTYDDVTDAFEGGTAAMIHEGSHRYTRIVEALGKEKVLLAKVPAPPGMFPSPTVTTAWTLGIPKGSPHPNVAWEFIEHYKSNGSEEIYARIAGGIPARKSTLQMPFFKTEEAVYMKWWLDYVAQNGEVCLHPVKWTQLNEVMTEALQKIILNPEMSVQKVLDEAVQRYNRM